jgi:hypothetical protein
MLFAESKILELLPFFFDEKSDFGAHLNTL